ncbi:MAG TPA: inorganic diphosphatase [Bryobacteraceae bacterium]|nr:inorganic diphosphatase [Bryobacteraceae bacterium]
MRTFYRFDPGPQMPELVRMIVEIPKNSNHKFEFDPDHGVFQLSRTLYSPIHYPGDYGFIPGTVAEDADPLDILCMVNSPSYPGILIYVRPVAVLDLVDEGKLDHKILAVPNRDPRFDAIRSLVDMRPHWRAELEHFFAIYKELEEKETEIRGWRDREDAWQVIRESRLSWETNANG